MARSVIVCLVLALSLSCLDQVRCVVEENNNNNNKHAAAFQPSSMNSNPIELSDGVMPHEDDEYAIEYVDEFNNDDDDDGDERFEDLSKFAGVRTMAKRPSWAGKRSSHSEFYYKRPLLNSRQRYGQFKKNMLRYRTGRKPTRFFRKF